MKTSSQSQLCKDQTGDSRWETGEAGTMVKDGNIVIRFTGYRSTGSQYIQIRSCPFAPSARNKEIKMTYGAQIRI